MAHNTFKAFVLSQTSGRQEGAFQELSADALPEGDVLVRVVYSSLNYKDGLAVTGKGKIARSYPMVPGIDLAGTVEESSSPDFKPGDQVVLTGWGVGERHWGGFAELARVKSEWLLHLPEGFTPEQAMAVGTAGVTAMLAILALEDHGLRPGDHDVVVTGASGGVGSTAVAVLSRLGYNVTASSGRGEDFLRSLGAHEIIDRSVLGTPTNRPLESERWAGAVDTVGGDTLAGILRTLRTGASVAACGNASGPALNTTVFPFILRGVNLLGVDSVTASQQRRKQVWSRLNQDLPKDVLRQLTQVEPLADLPRLASEIVDGKVRGRVVINVQG